MSKASEYAARVKAATDKPAPLQLSNSTGVSVFEVTADGNLTARGADLDAQHVPAIIAWLQATFLDPPPVVYSVGGCGVHDATSGAAAEALIPNDPRANVVITCQPAMPDAAEWTTLYYRLLSPLSVHTANALFGGSEPCFVREHGGWVWRTFLRASSTPHERGPYEHSRGPTDTNKTRVVWYWASICVEGVTENPENALTALVAWLRSMGGTNET